MIDDLTRNILEQRDNIENQRNREIKSNEESYIKQLQQENNQLKEKINTYENPEDLTLMFMYCDEKAKDKIKQLKEIEKEHQKINGELREENKKLKKQVEDLKADYGTIAQIERDLYKEVIEEVKRVLRCDDIAVLKYHGEPSETTSYEIVTVDLLQILDKGVKDE